MKTAPSMRLRLSILFFLQFFGLGATFPIRSHYLVNILQFSGREAGLIFSASSCAALASPAICAALADRFIPGRRLFALCHLLSAFCLWRLASERSFAVFLLVYLVYSVLSGPTLMLAQAQVFQHLDGRRERFGGIRVWGTIGWVAVAWLFGYFWLRQGGALVEGRLRDAFLLSAICSLLLAGYSILALPAAAACRPDKCSLLPREALQVLRAPGIPILLLLCFCSAFLDRYFYFGAAPYLKWLGTAEADILPALSIAQLPEIAVMGCMGSLLLRRGFRTAILLGLAMHVLRFTLLAAAPTVPLTILAIVCHGAGFALFFTTAYVYLDHQCNPASRAGAHLLFSLLSGGAAAFVGSLTAGEMIDLCGGRFSLFWSVPAAVAVITLGAAARWFPTAQPARLVAQESYSA